MAKKRHPALFDVMSRPRSQGRSLIPPTHSSLRSPIMPKIMSWLKRSESRPVSHPDSNAESTPIDFPADDPSTAGAMPPSPRVPGVDLKVDPDNYQIQFKVTYTSAIISGFAILVIVGLAYLLGSHRRPAEAVASDNPEIARLGPVAPEVLNVTQTPKPSNPKTAPAVPVAPAPPRDSGRVAVQPQDSTPQQGRTFGLNYVVIQSYRDDEDAIGARDLLLSEGVPATVEKGLPGWGKDWYSVVGMRGFDRTSSNPDYEKYIAKIMAVSKKFAGTQMSKIEGTSKFKEFKPVPVQWKAPQSANPSAPR